MNHSTAETRRTDHSSELSAPADRVGAVLARFPGPVTLACPKYSRTVQLAVLAASMFLVWFLSKRGLSVGWMVTFVVLALGGVIIILWECSRQWSLSLNSDGFTVVRGHPDRSRSYRWAEVAD